MATYHCDIKVIGRTHVRGVVAAAAYRAGAKLRDERSGTVYDYRRRRGIVHTEIIAPLSAPAWIADRLVLWNSVEQGEKRRDAQLAREVLVSLPKELHVGQQLDLVRHYVFQNFVNQGMVADIAIHAPAPGGQNHHAHILLTLRNVTPAGFGLKERAWNARSRLHRWRRSWAELTNHYLEAAGCDDRVDHRSRATRAQELNAAAAPSAVDRLAEPAPRPADPTAAAMTLDAPPTVAVMDTRELPPPQTMPPLETAEAVAALLGIVAQPAPTATRQAALADQRAQFEDRLREYRQASAEWPEVNDHARFELHAAIETAWFDQHYYQCLAALATPDRAVCARRQRDAERDYRHHVAEWIRRAVWDSCYPPRDAAMAERVLQHRLEIETQRAAFEKKAAVNGWRAHRRTQAWERIEASLNDTLSRALGLTMARGRSR